MAEGGNRFGSTLREIVTNRKVVAYVLLCTVLGLALEPRFGSVIRSLTLTVGIAGASLLLRQEDRADTQADCLRYGTGRGVRTFGLVGVLGFSAGVVVLAADGEMAAPDRAVAAAFCVLGAVAMYWTSIRPALILRSQTVTVRRFGSSLEFPIADLSFASGGTVLWLHRHTADPVRVMAVSTDNVTLALGRPGRAERVADEINALLGPAAMAAADGTRPSRGVNWRLLLGLAIAAALQIGLVVAFRALEPDGAVDCVKRRITLPSFGEYEEAEVDACVPSRQP